MSGNIVRETCQRKIDLQGLNLFSEVREVSGRWGGRRRSNRNTRYWRDRDPKAMEIEKRNDRRSMFSKEGVEGRPRDCRGPPPRSPRMVTVPNPMKRCLHITRVRGIVRYRYVEYTLGRLKALNSQTTYLITSHTRASAHTIKHISLLTISYGP